VLVLSRKENESIVVPASRLEIVVLEILQDRVRLGISAPDHVDIYRHEVWQQICFDEYTKEQEDDEDHKR